MPLRLRLPIVGVLVMLIAFLALFPVVSAQSARKIFLPLVTGAPVPPATESRYLVTTAHDTLYNYGCKQGQANLLWPYGVSILFFGKPTFDTATQQYGTILLGSSQTFVSVATIEAAAEAWIDGYWSCTPLHGPPILLAVGTSNLGSGTTFAHGQAWALLVNNLLGYINDHGFSGQINVRGASNIELAWNTPAATKDWLNGYTSAAQRTLFVVQDCSGCPYPAHPDWLPDNGWTYENLRDVDWNTFLAEPMPEIYAPNTSAAQWQAFAVWLSDVHANNLTFLGAFTQFQACIDHNDPCTGTHNTPVAGWSQFYNTLNQSTKTEQPLQWSTDVRWNF